MTRGDEVEHTRSPPDITAVVFAEHQQPLFSLIFRDETDVRACIYFLIAIHRFCGQPIVYIFNGLPVARDTGQESLPHHIGELLAKINELEERAIVVCELFRCSFASSGLQARPSLHYANDTISNIYQFCSSRVRHIENITLANGRAPRAFTFMRAFLSSSSHPEVVLGWHIREPNSPTNVEDEGAHSGIVRVVSQFRSYQVSNWGVSGLGTIIGDQYVVTVGHNVWLEEYGPARDISVLRDGHAGLELHRVRIGAVHADWARTFSPHNDIAVLRVCQPFDDKIRRLKYETTPTCVTDVRIYGFPSDMPPDRNQVGRQLCYSQSRVEYEPRDDLIHHNGDIKYGISIFLPPNASYASYASYATFRETVSLTNSKLAGTSGGPVLDDSDTVIGVHRGAHHQTANRAVVFNRHGNDIDKFKRILAPERGGGWIQDPEITQGYRSPFGGSIVDCFTWD